MENKLKDYMNKHQPIFSGGLKGFGLAYIASSIASSLISGDTSAATPKAIIGTGIFMSGYLADIAAYTKGYFNEKLNILKNDSSELEEKLKN